MRNKFKSGEGNSLQVGSNDGKFPDGPCTTVNVPAETVDVKKRESSNISSDTTPFMEPQQLGHSGSNTSIPSASSFIKLLSCLFIGSRYYLII